MELQAGQQHCMVLMTPSSMPRRWVILIFDGDVAAWAEEYGALTSEHGALTVALFFAALDLWDCAGWAEPCGAVVSWPWSG